MEFFNSEEDFRTIISQDVCSCCLASDVKFVSLSKCKHTSILEFFFKFKFLHEDTVICYKCHHFLTKIEAFKAQIQETLAVLWKKQTSSGIHMKKYPNYIFSTIEITTNVTDTVDNDTEPKSKQNKSTSTGNDHDDLIDNIEIEMSPDGNLEQTQINLKSEIIVELSPDINSKKYDNLTTNVKIEESSDCEPASPLCDAETEIIENETTLQSRERKNKKYEAKRMNESRVRSSCKQLTTMLEFMERHRDFALGRMKISNPQHRRKSDHLWVTLTNLLNSVSGGRKKTLDKWKKVWSDWKCKTTKRAQMRRRRSREGRGPTKTTSWAEQRMAALVGHAAKGNTAAKDHAFDTTTASQTKFQNGIVSDTEHNNIGDDINIEFDRLQKRSKLTADSNRTQYLTANVKVEVNSDDNTEQTQCMTDVTNESSDFESDMPLSEISKDIDNENDPRVGRRGKRKRKRKNEEELAKLSKRNEMRVRSSCKQLATMLEFMERHRELALGRLRISRPERADQLWETLTNLLNSVNGRRQKSLDKWKKVWCDWKSNIKRKVLTSRRLSSEGRDPIALSKLEQRVWALISSGDGDSPQDQEPDSPPLSPVPSNSLTVVQPIEPELNTSDEEAMREDRSYTKRAKLKDKRARSSIHQIAAMVEFMERHGDPALWKNEGRERAEQLWENLTKILNSVDGCNGTVEKWRRAWTDWKFKTKKKVALLSGRDESSVLPLTKLEERAWAIVSQPRPNAELVTEGEQEINMPSQSTEEPEYLKVVRIEFKPETTN